MDFLQCIKLKSGFCSVYSGSLLVKIQFETLVLLLRSGYF